MRTVDKIVKTADEWQAQLSAAAFYVARQRHRGRLHRPYHDNHEAGLYRCVCVTTRCSRATQNTIQAQVGRAWQPIASGNVVEFNDTSFGMVRTAVSCALCDAHLGHVFDDGPDPTGLRYCMNGVAMRFIQRPAA